MRVVLLVLLVVMSACSAPAGSAETTTTTTTPATTTTAEATTTTMAATTTTEPECVERDGVLYDSRGFVCPPNMTLDQNQFTPNIVGYRPGSYTTRIFEPVFSFTRDVTFQSGGENSLTIHFDENPNCRNPECHRFLVALSPEFASQIRSYPFDSHDWVLDLTLSSVEYWGASGTQIDFTIEDCPHGVNGCAVLLDDLPIETWGWPEFTRVRMLFVEVPNGPLGFEMGTHPSRFDQYWTEVVEPILSSIEFNDG